MGSFPMQVRERYIIDGQSTSSCKRRDLRKGRHQGTAEAMRDGGVRLHLGWGDPHGGKGTDEFKLISANELRVESTLELSDGSKGGFYAVYSRRR